MIYFFSYFIFLYISIFSFVKIKKEMYWVYLLLLFYFFILISGFRFETGNDYFSYVDIFNRLPNQFFTGYNNKQIEDGFENLLIILKFFGLSAQSLFIISSIVITTGLFYISYKFNKNFFFLIVFLIYLKIFFYSNMSVIRQGIALIFLLESINQQRIWKSLLLIIIASQFHISAIVFFPIILGLRINKRYDKLLFILFFLILFFNFNGNLLQSLFQVLLHIPKFNFYDKADSVVNTVYQLRTFYIRLFLVCLLYKFQKKNIRLRNLYLLNFFALIFLTLFFPLGEIFNRIMIYFEIPMIFGFIELTKYYKTKLSRQITYLFLYSYYTYSFLNLLNEWNEVFFPFKFYNFL